MTAPPIEALCSPWWLDRITAMTAAFADGIPDGFLEIPAVAACGLVYRDSIRSALLDFGVLDFKLPNAAAIRFAGAADAMTTTCAAHAYHLLMARPQPAVTVEWGGGFGNLARLNSGRHTIVDVPVMTMLAGEWLAVAAPERQIELCGHEAAESLSCELFLSTFALSECSDICHDWVIDELDWCAAERVVLALTVGDHYRQQHFPAGERLRRRLRASGFTEVPGPFPSSVYLHLHR